ncbi:MAG: 4-hydroxy-2-oxovalerate aldolase [Candidatus Omnitrophica bacterium]|nr:4-hydroxy-2-oxovalerate aldolase [Candidatus Omnitrophota bacterium]
MDNKKKIDVLDCTLRDGSYLIDHQFTAEDTYLIVLGLARAGFPWIEIGHGTGLGSARVNKGYPAASDEEYILSAKKALNQTKAKIGMFFIPGIGTMDDLIMANRLGLHFIRIGTNVTEISQAKPYIEKAKELGMVVCSNLMKSYAVSIKEFLKLAKQSDEFGADVITVVDSAGGMFPEDVRGYVEGLRDVTNKRIGFHGHNNLQLAVANTLEAIRSGADMVDSSLQGIGRSAGNTQTEILVMVADKLGYQTGIDIYKTLDLGERVIKPMVTRTQGVDDMSLVSGIAQFHSGFSKIIYDVAKKYNIDPRRLIMEVSEKDRVNVSYSLAEKIAQKIRKAQKKDGRAMGFGSSGIPAVKMFHSVLEQIQTIAQDVVSQSKKTGKESVFCLTISSDGKTRFPYIRQSPAFVISNVEVGMIKDMEKIVEALDGQVDWLLLDEDAPLLREQGLDRKIQRSRLAWYSEKRVLYLSVLALLSQSKPKKDVLVFSSDEDFLILKTVLGQQGIRVVKLPGTLKRKTILEKIGTVISFGINYAKTLSKKSALDMASDVVVLEVRPGAFPEDFWNAICGKGHRVCRVDTKAALASELNLAIETKKAAQSAGMKNMRGICVVSGGYIGPKGSIVVDYFDRPSRIIGIADGRGGLLSKDKEKRFVKQRDKLQQMLIENLYTKEY